MGAGIAPLAEGPMEDGVARGGRRVTSRARSARTSRRPAGPPSFLEGLRRPEVLDPALVGPRRRVLVLVGVVGALLAAQVWVSLSIQELGYEIEYVSRIAQRLDREQLELHDSVTRESRSALVQERAADVGLGLPEMGQTQRIAPATLAEVGLAQP
jgi:hypothetical protein